MKFLPDGAPAPPFALQAVVSERPINLQNTNVPLLLVFHSYQTASQVGELIPAVREVYPHPEQALIASVADMRDVPRLFQGAAKKIMRSTYQQAAKQIPAGQNPADHIIILPDWQGNTFEAYHVPDTRSQLALVLIDPARTIHSSYQGPQPAQAAITLLAENRARNGRSPQPPSANGRDLYPPPAAFDSPA